MMLARWDPFGEFRRKDRAMSRLWPGFRFTGVVGGVDSWAVPLDVVKEGDNIVVRASLPGVGPEDIQVTVEDGLLTIKGEYKTQNEERKGEYLMREHRTGTFHRAVRMPDTVDTDKAESSHEHGVLTITFPKVEGKKAKRLEIKAAA